MDENCEQCRSRATARDPNELKDLNCRLNRIIGQLNGIQKMLNENRYCGDILTQVAAAENALQSLGYQLLQTHMKTCMCDDIKAGKEESVDEVLSLMKKLKV
jgi:DNA-binding FrmR family transcriptional regulator